MLKITLKILFLIFLFSVFQYVFLCCFTGSDNNVSKNPRHATQKSNPNDTLTNKIQALNKHGVKLRDNGQYKAAFNTHLEALRLAKEINDTLGQIFALNNIGTDLRRTASNSEASSYHYAALELAVDDQKYLKSRAVAMNGLGNIFLSLNKIEQAEAYFRQSLEIEQQLNSPLGQAINYANIAETFRMKKQWDSAFYYYNQSLAQNKITKSDLGIAICKKSIGNIYLERGNTSQAVRLMREAANLMSHSNDIFHKLEIEIPLCQVLIETDNLEEARAVLDKILKMAHLISSYESLYLAYDLKTKLEEKQNDYRSAYLAKEKVLAYRDSILSQNNEVRILELENRYRNKESAQQIELLTAGKAFAENTKRNQQRFFILLSLLLIALIVLLYFRYQNRRRMSKELEKVNELKTHFFTNISHEFRTPLTLIKAPVENMIENNKCEKMQEELNIVLRNTNQMLFLVEQLLNFSKIEAGKFKINAQPNDLAMTIANTSASFEYYAVRKKIDYKSDITPSGEVWYDANIVEIICVNLLSNAMKFTPQYGNVVLKTEVSESNSYRISVQNTTEKDFTEKELSHIFDRFNSTASNSRLGTGIGLSLVKEICTLYRSEITLNYDNNQIAFVVNLPVHKSHFSKEEISHENTTDSSFAPLAKENTNIVAAGDSEAPVILLVEDNDDMRYFLRQIFLHNYQIIEAKDGKEGIRKATELIPDIIISDVMMPNISGLTLCESLKNHYLTNHIPILLLTALGAQDSVIEGLECKADDYITKPFNSRALLAKVKNQLDHRDVLVKKYREDIMYKPLEAVLKENKHDFAFLLNRVSKEITRSDFGVDEFCSMCLMSRTQLHRKLKALTGLSATGYIRIQRIKVASEILKDPSFSITDVCYASGFNDTSYFSKCFKEEFNCSPADYRKQFLT